MDTMQFYKGTEQECLAYNDIVTAGENYQGTTTRWDVPHYVEPYWYILKHPNYLSEMAEETKGPNLE